MNTDQVQHEHDPMNFGSSNGSLGSSPLRESGYLQGPLFSPHDNSSPTGRKKSRKRSTRADSTTKLSDSVSEGSLGSNRVRGPGFLQGQPPSPIKSGSPVRTKFRKRLRRADSTKLTSVSVGEKSALSHTNQRIGSAGDQELGSEESSERAMSGNQVSRQSPHMNILYQPGDIPFLKTLQKFKVSQFKDYIFKLPSEEERVSIRNQYISDELVQALDLQFEIEAESRNAQYSDGDWKQFSTEQFFHGLENRLGIKEVVVDTTDFLRRFNWQIDFDSLDLESVNSFSHAVQSDYADLEKYLKSVYSDSAVFTAKREEVTLRVIENIRESFQRSQSSMNTPTGQIYLRLTVQTKFASVKELLKTVHVTVDSLITTGKAAVAMGYKPFCQTDEYDSRLVRTTERVSRSNQSFLSDGEDHSPEYLEKSEESDSHSVSLGSPKGSSSSLSEVEEVEEADNSSQAYDGDDADISSQQAGSDNPNSEYELLNDSENED